MVAYFDFIASDYPLHVRYAPVGYLDGIPIHHFMEGVGRGETNVQETQICTARQL